MLRGNKTPFMTKELRKKYRLESNQIKNTIGIPLKQIKLIIS